MDSVATNDVVVPHAVHVLRVTDTTSFSTVKNSADIVVPWPLTIHGDDTCSDLTTCHGRVYRQTG
jgi:hypothetical protein